MNILALDLSTKSTGFAVFYENKIADHGIIKATSKNTFDRYSAMKEEILKIVKEYDIDTLILEDVIPTNRGIPTVQKVLTQLQGIIVHSIYEYTKSLNIIYYTASEWRKINHIKQGPGVKRENLKQQDIAKVKELYKIDCNDDEADALLILNAYLVQKKADK